MSGADMAVVGKGGGEVNSQAIYGRWVRCSYPITLKVTAHEAGFTRHDPAFESLKLDLSCHNTSRPCECLSICADSLSWSASSLVGIQPLDSN